MNNNAQRPGTLGLGGGMSGKPVSMLHAGSPATPQGAPMAPGQLGSGAAVGTPQGQKPHQHLAGPAGSTPTMSQMPAQQGHPIKGGGHVAMTHSGQQPPPTTAPVQPQSLAVNQPPTLLCKYGAEYVQEIVCKAIELFQFLRVMCQAANNPVQQEERKTKIKEFTYYINLFMRKLRMVHERLGDSYRQLEYAISAADIEENLIPFKQEDDSMDGSVVGGGKTTTALSDEEADGTAVERDDTETFSAQPANVYYYPRIPEHRVRGSAQLAALEQEHSDLLRLNQLRNRQLKEIIDRLRTLVWDINSMLAMRKP